MKALRVLATFLSGPFLLIGAVWIFQGVGLLPGSFMTGSLKWTIIGTPIALIGVLMAWWVNRPNRWTVIVVSVGMTALIVGLYLTLAHRA
jgi:hypothetical protein